MSFSVLRQQFQVNSVPVTVDTDTRVNIKKRHEYIRYKTISNQNRINIAYLMGTQSTPGNNLVISDRSTSLTQNRVVSSSLYHTATTKQITLSVDKFLISHVFTTETPTKPETPLFYVHTLADYDPSNVYLQLLNIEFADYNLNPITITEYYLDSTTGEVFNNIENTYDDSTTEFDVTYIKYTVRDTSMVGSDTISVYHELISNSAIYTPADFDDIDEFGQLISGRKKYLLEEQLGGEQFVVTLPDLQRYAYKETPASRIRVLSPVAIDLTAPWNVRVSNGQFITSLQVGLSAYRDYKYFLAEFNSQTFQPFPPYKFMGDQSAIWLNSNLVKVAKGVVVSTGIYLFIDIIVKDQFDVLKYVYSNDPSKIGTAYTSTVSYTEGILSVDSLNGFIELEGPIEETDQVSVSYYTEETEYEFTTVDFNPVNNLDILNQRVALYVSPEYSLSGDLDATLYYLVMDSVGRIAYSSQADENSGGIDPATMKLLHDGGAGDFNTDGSPKRTFYYDIPSTEDGLASRVSGVNSSVLEEFSFIDKYTVESVLLNPAITTTGELTSNFGKLLNFQENPRFLVLADMYVGDSQSPSSLSVFDARIQGGGIKTNNIDDARAEQHEIDWYWDFNSKRPYPGIGAFKVEVPYTLLSDYGGDYDSIDAIKDVASRHIKSGGYAIVDTYGIDPVITTLSPASGEFYFEWPSYGSGVNYNVYYSTEIESHFALWSGSPITDVSTGNDAAISGLDIWTTYYTYLAAIDDNGYECPGPIVGTTTTA